LGAFPLRKLLAFLFLIAPLAAARNTIKGVGKDVKNSGEHGENNAVTT
jgi:predicted small secreted protein